MSCVFSNCKWSKTTKIVEFPQAKETTLYPNCNMNNTMLIYFVNKARKNTHSSERCSIEALIDMYGIFLTDLHVLVIRPNLTLVETFYNQAQISTCLKEKREGFKTRSKSFDKFWYQRICKIHLI